MTRLFRSLLLLVACLTQCGMPVFAGPQTPMGFENPDGSFSIDLPADATELPQFPGLLSRVEIQATPESRVFISLFWPGLAMGDPYAIYWDRSWSMSMNLDSMPLHQVGVPYAGHASGSSAWSSGVDLTFFVPDNITTVSKQRQLRRFQGRETIPLSWNYQEGGFLYHLGPNTPSGFGVSRNMLGVSFRVTYYPLE